MMHMMHMMNIASQVEEKNAKTRKELTDYVEETFGCIVCMVRICIVTIEII